MFQSLVHRYLGPQYTSIQKSRNVCVVLMAFLWIFIVLENSLSAIVIGGTRDEYIRRSPAYLLIATLPIGLARAHREDIVSDTTVSFLLHMCGLTNSLNSLFVSAVRPVDLYAVCLMVAMTALQPQQWRLLCLTILPGLVIMSYKSSFGMYPGFPALQLVEAEHRILVDVLTHCRMALFLPTVLKMVSVHTKSYYSSIRTLESAVTIATEVSEHLADYNTDAAEATLRKYTEMKDCDKKLQTVLSVIVANLKKYKPFLPNYVITPSCDMEGVESEGNESYEEDDEEEGGENRFSDLASSVSDVVDIDAQAQPPNIPQQVTEATRNTLNPPALRVRPKRRDSHQRAPLSSLSLLTMAPVKRMVSYSMIHFQYKNDDVIDNPLPLRDFIEKVHHAANSSNAAIHSCICDTVHITWNAATPCVNPKQRAVAALRMLSAKSKVTLSARTEEVNGAVVSCEAECRLTGKLHHTFLMNFPRSNVLSEMYRYACKVKTNVVCKETAKEIHDTPSLMLVDIIDSNELYEITSPEFLSTYGVLMRKAVHALTLENYGEIRTMLKPSLGTGPASLIELFNKSEKALGK
eukprot:PhF_6_TR10789/c0_g1_i1/m.17345